MGGRDKLIVVLGAVIFLLMAGGIVLLGFGFAEQSDQVDELEAENAHILEDHASIGKAFATQTKKLAAQTKRLASQEQKLDAAISSSYRQGFQAGQRVRSVPPRLRTLRRYAAEGMLVPRVLPSKLDPAGARISTSVDGYVVRWPPLAVFASRAEPVSVWTRQALGGVVRRVIVGSRRVSRLNGPNGVVYAWHEGGATYALIAFPRYESVARTLIAAME